MKIYLSALCISMCNILYAGHTVVQRDYTIEYSIEEHDQKPIVLYFNQECTVDNAQNNACTHPCPHTSPSITKTAGSKIASWLSFNDLLTPFKVGIAVCLIGGIYVLKTKLTLYGLSKACFQNAFWSLWQTKSAGITEDHNPETELLHDILKTYQTDQYALAVARFLQDTDREMEQLSAYLKQAKRANSSMIYFLLPDLSDDITEIESRLTRLAYLKQKVLNWLAYSNEQMRPIR